MNLNAWVLAAALVLPGPQGKTVNFSGTWEMDLKKSEGLPPAFGTVESYVAEIRHRGDSLALTASMAGNGQKVEFPPFLYVLNGEETYRPDSLRGSFRWITGNYSKDGKKVRLTTRVLMVRPDGAKLEFTQSEEWRFTGGDTMEMTVRQKFRGSDSTRSERRIFRKVK